MLRDDGFTDLQQIGQLAHAALALHKLAGDHQAVVAAQCLEQGHRLFGLFANIFGLHTCIYAKVCI